MAKARAIMKRRKAVRNIKKITRTMQMIATAKFQKSLKRAVGTKPYTMKVRELVRELAASVGNVEHPLLRKPEGTGVTNKIAVVVLTANRGLAGAYNGNVLRAANAFLKEQERQGKTVELYASGKKGVTYFTFQKRPITQKLDITDTPAFAEVRPHIEGLVKRFIAGEVDAVYVAYMNFISTGVQKPEVMALLPLSGVAEAADHIGRQQGESDAQIKAGALNRAGGAVAADVAGGKTVEYDFMPDAASLLNELLPLTVQTAFFQAFLDATTSEHVARMVSMKSATDNADKMSKSLQLEYNRARQSQITTELSEIMGGVEAMK